LDASDRAPWFHPSGRIRNGLRLLRRYTEKSVRSVVSLREVGHSGRQGSDKAFDALGRPGPCGCPVLEEHLERHSDDVGVETSSAGRTMMKWPAAPSALGTPSAAAIAR